MLVSVAEIERDAIFWAVSFLQNLRLIAEK